MTARLGYDWNYPLPMVAARGTPEERAAAVRCLARLSLRVADGAAGLRVVLQALALDDSEDDRG